MNVLNSVVRSLYLKYKQTKICYVLIFTTLLFSTSCEDGDERVNRSNFKSLPIGLSSPSLVQAVIDEKNDILYVAFRGSFELKSVIHKVDLKTLEILRTTTIDKIIPYGNDNIVVTSDGGFIASFAAYEPIGCLLFKFDSDLNEVKQQRYSNEFYFGRILMKPTTSGSFLTVESNKDTAGVSFLRYAKMDEDFNRVTNVLDTSSLYSSLVFLGQDVLQTSDNGYLYINLQVNPPRYTSDMLAEKRDANHNLLWRKVVPNMTSRLSVESNGNYYIYGETEGDDKPYFIVLSPSGELLEKKEIPSGGITTPSGGNLIKNHKNEFMIVGTTTENSAEGNRKVVLYNTDEQLNVESHHLFGGNGAVDTPRILTIDDNKYLLMYIDGSYQTDGNINRLVLQYIDSEGNIIN